MPDETKTKIETQPKEETPAAPAVGEGASDGGDSPPSPSSEATTSSESKVESGEKSEREVSGGNEAPREDWREARIRVLTAKLAEERTKSATLKSQVDQDPSSRDATIREEARQLSEQQLAVDRFNSACAEAATKGRERFGAAQFDSSLKGLLEVAGAQNGQWLDNESAQRYNQFLAVAFEAGDAARLIHDLGNDKQEFARILGLPPVKQAAELARRSAKGESAASLDAPKLPKPITPLGSRGNSASRLDPASPEDAKQMSTADWMAAREEQAKKNWVDMRRGVR